MRMNLVAPSLNRAALLVVACDIIKQKGGARGLVQNRLIFKNYRVCQPLNTYLDYDTCVGKYNNYNKMRNLK